MDADRAPFRTRWNDDRLDDLYEDFRQMRHQVERVPVLEARLTAIADDTANTRRNIHGLRDDIAATAARQALERKTDRRWLVGTILTAALLVVGALQVLVGHIP